jgi:hypothetical protein
MISEINSNDALRNTPLYLLSKVWDAMIEYGLIPLK